MSMTMKEFSIKIRNYYYINNYVFIKGCFLLDTSLYLCCCEIASYDVLLTFQMINNDQVSLIAIPNGTRCILRT